MLGVPFCCLPGDFLVRRGSVSFSSPATTSIVLSIVGDHHLHIPPVKTVSIKSDKRITRMAREHGMIEPFVESQARTGVVCPTACRRRI